MIVRRYWQPFQEFNTVKQQLDQLFDEFSPKCRNCAHNLDACCEPD